MKSSDLAAPQLAAIDVKGITRAAFIARGALAAGAVYGGSMVAPFVGRALGQAGDDVEVLNFALMLEHVESELYKSALKEVDELSSEVKELAEELERNELEHADTLTQTIQQLGGKPEPAAKADFGDAFASEERFLDLALTFENTGISAYNGAAPLIESRELLAAAGAIAQVAGRHAGLLALLTGEEVTPSGPFDKPLSEEKVRRAIKPFLAS